MASKEQHTYPEGGGREIAGTATHLLAGVTACNSSQEREDRSEAPAHM